VTSDAAAFAACAEITRTQARNFYYGLRLLPEPKRSALYVVYAWMRVADDIADADGVAVDARRASLDAFERDTRAALAGGEGVGAGEGGGGGGGGGGSGDFAVVLDGLARVARRFPLVDAEFLGAIEGQRMDLAPRVYADFAEVERYCDRVASTVGRICLDIWGVRDGADAELARELSTKRGVAFQLTNILRDYREDHDMGRVYLPAEDFRRFDLTPERLRKWSEPGQCAEFIRAQCDRAEQFYARSAPLDRMITPDCLPTLWAMTEIYHGLLGKIRAHPAAIAGDRRVRLSSMRKAWIAWRAGRMARGARS
jgi:phytoene synthase